MERPDCKMPGELSTALRNQSPNEIIILRDNCKARRKKL